MTAQYDSDPKTGFPLAVVTEFPHRKVRLTDASVITMRKAKWLWDLRIPLGEMALLAGREGLGKSTVGYTLAADVTQGRLEGHYGGTPRNVAIAATEDSWEHTIVPRLAAAGADLARVFRIEVEEHDGSEAELSLPRDLDSTEAALVEYEVALLVLDPLMSRLSASLDTHKDGEVRQALEPLVKIAQRTGCSVLGLIHVGKSGAKDPLNAVMASKAFTAVARSVLFTLADPDDDRNRLLGLAKSNLGPTDVPILSFTVESTLVGQDPDDGADITAGRVVWGDDRMDSMADVYESAASPDESDGPTSEIDDWLRGLLLQEGGSCKAGDVFTKGKADGFSESALKRARTRLGIKPSREGFGQGSWWTYDPAKDTRRPRSAHSGHTRAGGDMR